MSTPRNNHQKLSVSKKSGKPKKSGENALMVELMRKLLRRAPSRNIINLKKTNFRITLYIQDLAPKKKKNLLVQGGNKI